jgi:predicted RNA-binding Zn-ribbon protein involved in translation (DUF1610 family)
LLPEPEQPDMREAWIDLECSHCGEIWEANPADLPAPVEPFTCPHCGQNGTTSEFAKTTRGFEILAEFHAD